MFKRRASDKIKKHASKEINKKEETVNDIKMPTEQTDVGFFHTTIEPTIDKKDIGQEKEEFLNRIKKDSESKEGVYFIENQEEKGLLVMTAETEEASSFLINNIKESFALLTKQDNIEQLVVGFDCEFKKNLSVKSMQISTDILSCVFDLQKITKDSSKLPDCIVQFLENENIFKLGVGVATDRERIKKTFDITTRGIVDVALIAMKLKLARGYRSLNYLATDLMSLQKRAKNNTKEGFILYSARDAYLGFAIGNMMFTCERPGEALSSMWSWLNSVKPTDLELLYYGISSTDKELANGRSTASILANTHHKKRKPTDEIRNNDFAKKRQQRAEIQHTVKHNLIGRYQSHKYKQDTENSIQQLVSQMSSTSNTSEVTKPSKSAKTIISNIVI